MEIDEIIKSAEQGNAVNQNILGLMYSEGEGVPQNHEKAVEWFQKAVNQGNDKAQYNLGRMYYLGKGVPQNYNKAVDFFKKSAQQGNTKAAIILEKIHQKILNDSKNSIGCPFCHTTSTRGVRVCKGCQATITYGVKKVEFTRLIIGMILLIIMVIVGMDYFPSLSFFGIIAIIFLIIVPIRYFIKNTGVVFHRKMDD